MAFPKPPLTNFSHPARVVPAMAHLEHCRAGRLGVAIALAGAVLLCGCNHFASQGMNVDGVRLHQHGDFQSAAARFQGAIASNPNVPNGYYNLAATLHQTGRMYGNEQDLRQAEDLYNQCLERDPNHPECYRGLAVLLTETGRRDAAFRLLQNWEASNPQLADPKIELARLLEETGDQDGAKARLAEALAADPYNSRALTALGRIRDESGEYLQALQDYERSLELNAHQPVVKQRIASLQAALGGPAIRRAAPASNTRVVQQPSPNRRY